MVCLTPTSPIIQLYNSEINEWEPDREIGTPTILLPSCEASASDGSFQNGSVNRILSNIKWTVNNVDIATLPEWNGKYSIDDTQNSPTRGAITIKKNILPSERIVLKFNGVITDTRLGINVEFSAEESLSTHDKSEDGYTVSLGSDTIFVYNPFKDRLLEYDYKVGNGLIAPSTAARNACLDANSYEQTIPITVFKGGKKMDSGYNYQILKIDSAGNIGALPNTNIINGPISSGGIKFDLRFIEKGDYYLKITVGGKEKTGIQFSINRSYPAISTEPVSGSDIPANAREMYNKIIITYDGAKIEYPQTVVDIDWYTDTESKKAVWHNQGDIGIINLEKSGIGNAENDSWMDIYQTISQKGIYYLAGYGSNTYTDGGNTLIFR